MASRMDAWVVRYGGHTVYERLRRTFTVLGVLTGFACAWGIASGAFLSYQGLAIAEDYTPLADAAMELQLSAANAHRAAVEQVLDGSEALPLEAREGLSEALVFANLIHKGGELDGETYHASKDPNVQLLIRQTLTHIDSFEQALQERQAKLRVVYIATKAQSEATQAFDSAVHQGVQTVLNEWPAGDRRTLAVFHLSSASTEMFRAIARGDVSMKGAYEELSLAEGQGVDTTVYRTLLQSLEQHVRSVHTLDGHALDVEMDKAFSALMSTAEEAEVRIHEEIGQAVTWVVRGRLAVSLLLLLVGVFAVRTGLLLGRAVSKSVVDQLQPAVDLAQAVASGDLTQHLEAADDPLEELDALRDALNHMAMTLSGVVGHISTTANALGEASTKVSSSSHVMKQNTTRVAQEVDAATLVSVTAREQMDLIHQQTDVIQSTASEMTTATTDMYTQLRAIGGELNVVVQSVGSVAESMEVLDHSICTLASTQEQMTAALTEVSSGVAQAAHIAEDASRRADDTAETVRGLSMSAQQIGEIVTLISHIADQTNLLALNATIEAAAAGEAGRGFAVVAQEVKALAQQSAEASSRIAERVRGIQNNTSEAVEAIGDVAAVISEVRQITVNMAAAIEEQSATADTIAGVVNQVAAATSDVRGASNAAASTSQAISQNVVEALDNVQAVASGIEQLAASVIGIAAQVREARGAVETSSANLSTVATASNESRNSAERADEAAVVLESLASDLNASVTQFTVAA